MGSVARASNVPYLGDLRQELLDEGPVLGLQWGASHKLELINQQWSRLLCDDWS